MSDALAFWQGGWRVSATMPGGDGGYEGMVVVAAAGDRLTLRWDITDGVYHGVGASVDDRLIVSCSPFDADIALALSGADDEAGRVFKDREGVLRRRFTLQSQTSGFGFGRIRFGDGVGIEALAYGDAKVRAAAWGRDIDRHVLLVYERTSDDAAKGQWTLGRSPAVGAERLWRAP